MNFRKISFAMAIAAFSLTSCVDGEDKGHSTPIDSTNLNGTAPATYNADNPANEQDTNYINANDTGTKVSNGPDNTIDSVR
jgi:hypothetical protein